MCRFHLTAFIAMSASAAIAQDPGPPPPPFGQKQGGSPNVKVLKHVENNPGSWKAADVELEQERGRPYVYVSGFINYDTQIYDITNPAVPKKIYQWRIEDPELVMAVVRVDPP